MTSDLILNFALIALISYLLGSIPSAYLIGRLRGIDIFKVGSGNMGATNIVRSAGLGWGFVVWFFDSSKAIIAMLLAGRLLPDHQVTAWVIAAIGAVIGHNWSFFAAVITGKLRGGKGAAATFGTMLLIVPLQTIAIMLAVCGIIIAVTRYVSLGVLVMFSLGTLWLFVLVSQEAMPWQYGIYGLAIMALMIVRFRENIQRLLAGTERRFGEKSGA